MSGRGVIGGGILGRQVIDGGMMGRRMIGHGMMGRAVVAGSLIVSAGASCPVGPSVSGFVDRAPATADAVTITYLGVGGWIMERGDVRLMTAPLFSNPSFVGTGVTGIASDSAAIDAGLEAYDLGGIRAILVGHGHYDHLMDVPYMARRYAPAATVVTTNTVRNLLGTWSGLERRLLIVDDSAGDVDHVGRWLDLGSGLRVMALRSHHAPHFDGYTFYEGTVDTPRDRPPRWATEWLDGPSFAFLIDFLDPDGSVAFRIYYQDAVAGAPRGFAPAEIMADRPTDVAILVPSTFDQVDWHPEAFIQNLRPRWVLLGHWEDFFGQPDGEARSVALTDVNHFRDRLRRVHEGEHWLPDLNTVFRFPTR